MPIFRVKSVKIYTGQKKFTLTPSVASVTIIRYGNHYWQPTQPLKCQPWCCSIAGGELFDRVIEDEFVLSEKACCIFTKQILEGVSYIHRQQIIHLDLKVSLIHRQDLLPFITKMFNPVQLVTFQPENILCLTKSGNRIKIIDFGLARRFEPMKKLQILFGTPEFVAPEVFFFSILHFLSFLYVLISYNCLPRWWTLSPSATAPTCGRWGWSHMSCEYLQEK